MINKTSREQFNKQADKYATWSVTRNLDYLQKYYEFCDIIPEDTLLDVACGSGDFPIFAAEQVQYAYGIDVSDKLIEIAKKEAHAKNLTNAGFQCADFETLDLPSKYSTIVCRMAFHHFIHYKDVFKKMYELCIPSGKIGVQDIVAHEDELVRDFFETFEKQVDNSHNCSLTKNDFLEMYRSNQLTIVKTMDLDREINVNEYIQHAVQSEASQKQINDLISHGLTDPRISKYLTAKDDGVYFKRKVFLILGKRER